ncbi:MAG TPA: TetR family transcriptional regulator [Gaiellaceae bacterium]|nr:TetR family transcriptional regulator [Gaiellaceae bacterium]
MQRLDRDSIVAAALDLADTRGLEAVTLRSLAELLGVTPMALYRHIAGKDALLDAMADELYRELLPRGRDGGDWWADLANVARASRRVLLAHPWAAPLFARPLSGPNGELLTALLHDRLRAAGFPRRDADELHHQLSNLVFALVAPELHGRPNRAAFERGLELLRVGLEARRRQQ